jgi:hypothetical protein
MSNLMLRLAAGLFWLTAIGLTAFIVPVARHLLIHRGFPRVFGQPAFSGPLAKVSVDTLVVILAAFLVVCVLEGIAGWLIWNGHRSGGVLGLALIPFAAIFWIGFELPIPPIIGLARAAIVIANWRLLD